MKHVQLKYGSREDINYFLSTISSENFISLTKEKENRYLLIYIEDENNITNNNITYAKELIRELLLADTRNGSDWNGYLVDLEERAKKFIEE